MCKMALAIQPTGGHRLNHIARFTGFWLLCALAFLVGCAQSPATPANPDSSSLGGPAPLRVGVSPNAPPMVYKNAQGALQGLEIDFANRLAKDLGRPVKFVELDFTDLISSVKSGDIDIIMAGMTITPARERQIAFVTPYMKTGQCVMVRMEDQFNYFNPTSILQVKGWVGAESGTTGDSFARRYMPNADVWGYPSVAKAGEALLNRKVNMVIGDMPTVAYLAQVSQSQPNGAYAVPTMLTIEFLAWGIAPGNTDLKAKCDKILYAWQADGSIYSMINAWVPSRAQ
jgi:ABC-type amino acid transport substrate-binding protein